MARLNVYGVQTKTNQHMSLQSLPTVGALLWSVLDIAETHGNRWTASGQCRNKRYVCLN